MISAKVLTIDDSRIARTLLSQNMSKMGYQVCEADSGKAGLALVDSEKPDIVLLDYMMPEMDGLTTFEKIHEKHPLLPVIMMTAMGSVNLAISFLKKGGSDFITKPIDDFEILDIKLRKTHENSRIKHDLVHSEAHARAIIETVGNGIITINDEGIIRVFNPAAEEIFGYSAQEIIGKKVNILIPSPYKERHDSFLLNYLTDRESTNVVGRKRELVGCRKDGSEVIIETNIHEMKIGQDRYFVGALTDMTDRKEAEKKVVDANAARQGAEEASQAKSSFLATVSHEMRTPLTAIIGFTEILKDESAGLGESVINIVDRIIANAKQQVLFINDILDIAKIEAGKMEYSFSKRNIFEIVEMTKSNIFGLAATRGIDFDIICSKKDDIFIYCDEVRINQVFSNIIGNAIKFADEGSTITINIAIKNGDVITSITDQGTPIPENEIEKIFDPFTQSSLTDDGSGGTGLGLSLCKKLINDHSGKIWAETHNDPSGATFYVSFPIFTDEKVSSL